MKSRQRRRPRCSSFVFARASHNSRRLVHVVITENYSCGLVWTRGGTLARCCSRGKSFENGERFLRVRGLGSIKLADGPQRGSLFSTFSHVSTRSYAPILLFSYSSRNSSISSSAGIRHIYICKVEPLTSNPVRPNCETRVVTDKNIRGEIISSRDDKRRRYSSKVLQVWYDIYLESGKS